MTDYFSFAAARVGPPDPRSATVRPSPRPVGLDAVDDPFESVAAPEVPDAEVEQTPPTDDRTGPFEPGHAGTVQPRSTAAVDDVAGPRPSPTTPSDEHPTTTRAPRSPVGAPDEAADGPVRPEVETPPQVEPRPLPTLPRTLPEPPGGAEVAATEPPPSGTEPPTVEHAGDGRDEAAPQAMTPPLAPAGPADALAMADAFMRDLLEPRPEPAAAAPTMPSSDDAPQVVIDQLTVEIVDPPTELAEPPRARLPRAAARLPAGRRTSWGS